MPQTIAYPPLPANPGGGNQLITLRAAALRLTLSVRSVYRMIGKPNFPVPRKLGKKTVFLHAEIERYISQLPKGVGA